MNICLLTQEWPPYGCGIGTYMFNLARGLVDAGHQVIVITHDQNPITLQGVVIHSVSLPKSNDMCFRMKRKMLRLFCGIRDQWSWSAFQLFESVIEKSEIDIVETAEFGAWGEHFVKNNKVPVVVRCHNPGHIVWSANQIGHTRQWPFPKSVQKQDKVEYTQTVQADGIISPSEALAYHLSLSWVIPLCRFSVIPNPIDNELFSPDPLVLKKEEILFVGRLELNKGVYDLASSLVPIFDYNSSVSVRFVGMDRPAPSSYRKLGLMASDVILSIIPMEYHSRVHFTAPVAVSEIADFQRRALLSVMPTRGFESFSYTVLEPMACGTPVIATQCGGPSEIITHKKDGLLVPPGRPDALTSAIKMLLEKKKMRAQFATEALITVEKKYSISVIVPQIIKYYDEVIGEFTLRK